jgi:hypothetical protein
MTNERKFSGTGCGCFEDPYWTKGKGLPLLRCTACHEVMVVETTGTRFTVGASEVEPFGFLKYFLTWKGSKAEAIGESIYFTMFAEA